MNIYVVSDEVCGTNGLLVNQLSRIIVQPTRVTPVIVVDNLYNLERPFKDDSPVVHAAYRLSLHEGDSAGAGSVTAICASDIANKLGTEIGDWVLFEFGQNDHATCIDFVRELARYNFMSPKLRNKNIVFLVPSIYLAYFSRVIIESFRLLPIGRPAKNRSPQIGMLFMSINIERFFISFRLLATPLLQFIRLAKFIFRRLLRTI